MRLKFDSEDIVAYFEPAPSGGNVDFDGPDQDLDFCILTSVSLFGIDLTDHFDTDKTFTDEDLSDHVYDKFKELIGGLNGA